MDTFGERRAQGGLRPRQPRPEPATSELVAFAADDRRRLAELEGGLDELRAERDAAMLAAYRAGVPIVEIAEVFTISHQRVSALVRKSGG